MNQVEQKLILIHMRPQDEPALCRAREEIAIGLNPLPLAQLVEAVMVACYLNSHLEERMKERIRDIANDTITRAGYRPSSIRPDPRVIAWLTHVMPGASSKRAINDFIRWIAEDWDAIRGVLPVRSPLQIQRLASMLPSTPN